MVGILEMKTLNPRGERRRMKKMIKGTLEAIAIFWLALTHQLGLCKKWHRKPEDLDRPYLSICPVIDRIMMYLYPLHFIERK